MSIKLPDIDGEWELDEKKVSVDLRGLHEITHVTYKRVTPAPKKSLFYQFAEASADGSEMKLLCSHIEALEEKISKDKYLDSQGWMLMHQRIEQYEVDLQAQANRLEERCNELMTMLLSTKKMFGESIHNRDAALAEHSKKLDAIKRAATSYMEAFGSDGTFAARVLQELEKV